MNTPDLWRRVRQARLVRVVVVYAAASWAVLQVTDLLGERLQLPPWLVPVAFVLLLVGLVMIAATAWVQSHPHAEARAAREEVPGAWEIDLGDVGRSVARGRLPHLTWGRSLLGGVVAFSLLFGLAGLYVVVKDRGRTFGPSEAVAGAAGPGVAILPFGVSDPSLERWREGMVDLLSTNLDGVGGLRAIDSRTVMAGWRERAGGEQAPSVEQAIEVARAVGARWAVVGSAVSTGRDLRLAATVYDAASGTRLGQHQVEGSPDSLFALVDRLSIDVIGTVLPEADDALPRVDLARVATTASLPALKAFLEGEALFRRSRWEDAIEAYERAVQEDSTFALAYRRLATAYGWAESIVSPRAQGYEEKAVRLVDRLPEREALLERASIHLSRAQAEGLELSREAVKLYPDDPEAWNLLGEYVWHLGDALLAPREEGERAFRRAVQLDPSFSPAYIHLIDNAFSMYADSARAAGLAETYLRLTARTEGGTSLAALPVVLDLAFGDAAHRRAAAAALDSLSTRALFGNAIARGWHPRLLDFQGRLLEEFATRQDANNPQLGPILRTFNALARGRPATAERLLEDPLTPAGFDAEALVYARVIGVPLAEERLDALLGDESPEDPDDIMPFYEGFRAAERGEWPDQAAAVERLRSTARARLAEGDSTEARFLGGVADGLDGFARWKRGEPGEALPLLVDAQQRAIGFADLRQPNTILRWWIAELMLELDRPRDAERYFTSLSWFEPMAYLRLGRLYEELEEFEKARTSYELFAAAWADPDPGLRSLRDEALSAARRLTNVTREGAT